MIDYEGIFKNEGWDMLGSHYLIVNHDKDRNRFHISGTYSGGSRYSIHTIFMDGDYFVLDGCKFNNVEWFQELARQIIETKAKPKIIKMYEENMIDKLPPKMKFEPESFDVDNITADWFTEIFQRVSMYESNGESVENVKMSKVDNKQRGEMFVIQFDLDCGRAGLFRGQTVTINNKGVVKVDIDDTPAEGGGIESVLGNCVKLQTQGKSIDEYLEY